jgi:hypothetical protein
MLSRGKKSLFIARATQNTQIHSVGRMGNFGMLLGLKGMKRQEVGENCIMRNFITCTLLQV